MRNKDRNKDDFINGVTIAILNSSYTNEHASRLFVEALILLDSFDEYFVELEEGK